ncbi:hypothetical protein ELBI_16 [Anabaena phage Elbi]|nr:hypothetical protein ELBI_16 [Anabaena phage Elbi]
MRKTDFIGWTIIIVLSIYFLTVAWYDQNSLKRPTYERKK